MDVITLSFVKGERCSIIHGSFQSDGLAVPDAKAIFGRPEQARADDCGLVRTF